MMAKYLFGKTEDGVYVPLKVDALGRLVASGSALTLPTVNTYADLPAPTTVNGKIYIVLTSTGIPFINRKSSGGYYSNGSAWNYLGDVVPYFADGAFEIYNTTDTTKKMSFDVSGILTGTKRTVTAQNASGTMAYLADIKNNIADLNDTSVIGPTTGQLLTWNGTDWVNGPAVTISAGSGISLFFSETASGVSDYETISQIPDTTAEQDESIVVNNETKLFEKYSTAVALGRTIIEAGIWTDRKSVV